MSIGEIVGTELPPDLKEPFARLRKDLKKAAETLSRRDARWLVDMYYTIQDERIRSASQKRTSEEDGEPHQLIGWVFETMRMFENSIKAALGTFAGAYQVGRWMQAQHGIGPVLSAAMLSNFDIRKAPTVGHMWRFAGLDPTLVWLGKDATKKLLAEYSVEKTLTEDAVQAIHKASGQHPVKIRGAFQEYRAIKGPTKKGKAGVQAFLAARPWNAKLKAICVFRMGECFVKFQNNEKDVYGHLLALKKTELVVQNERGDFKATAAAKIAENAVGKNTEAWKHFSEGRLPPAQIHQRARRWAVKLFLSHLHHVMHWDYFDKAPPAPYIFEKPNGEDHRHLIEPPLWPGDYGGRPLRQLSD